MLEFAVLGSGSSGNSAVVCAGDTRLLIDAGLSARQICRRLEVIGIDPDSLSAILLTHEHGDHVRGIDVFCRKRKLPVYATAHTAALVREQVRSEVVWRPFEAGSRFSIGPVEAESFSVPHDAVDPVGFVLQAASSRLGILSDVGHVTRLIVDRLRGVHTLFTEANYDELMLQNDTARPWPTKQRISNRHGHLSNEQTVELVREVAGPDLQRVVLGHLSSDCNCPDLASRLVRESLSRNGHSRVEVECAPRAEPLPLRPACPPLYEEATATSEEPVSVRENGCPPPRESALHHDKPTANGPVAKEVSDSGQLEWAF